LKLLAVSKGAAQRQSICLILRSPVAKKRAVSKEVFWYEPPDSVAFASGRVGHIVEEWVASLRSTGVADRFSSQSSSFAHIRTCTAPRQWKASRITILAAQEIENVVVNARGFGTEIL